MNHRFFRRALSHPILVPAFVAALSLAILLAAADIQAFNRATATIESGGKRHQFDIELAITAAERSKGLMYRRNLAPDSGMLFLFDRQQVVTMWMKNTFIPLDMLFIGEAGRIVSIHEGAVPHSLDTISSGVPAIAVLEVPAGTVGRLGIRAGDRVHAPGLP